MNWTDILVALITAAPATGVAWLSWRQSLRNHYIMNSRLDELVIAAGLAGVEKGVREERARHENKRQRD